MPNYQTNMYNKMRQQPNLVQKYEHAGIYSITMNGVVVYIGKSKNMLWRIAQHYVGIRTLSEHKYRLIAEAQRQGYTANFHVVCYAHSVRKADIEEELGEAEGYYIRKYKPILNTQIPNESNWRKFTLNKEAAEMTADEFIKAISNR